MDDHRTNSRDFKENNIPHHLTNELGVVHRRTSHFDEEGLSAKALQVGEGLDEHSGFFSGGSHASNVNEDSLS